LMGQYRSFFGVAPFLMSTSFLTSYDSSFIGFRWREVFPCSLFSLIASVDPLLRADRWTSPLKSPRPSLVLCVGCGVYLLADPVPPAPFFSYLLHVFFPAGTASCFFFLPRSPFLIDGASCFYANWFHSPSPPFW